MVTKKRGARFARREVLILTTRLINAWRVAILKHSLIVLMPSYNLLSEPEGRSEFTDIIICKQKSKNNFCPFFYSIIHVGLQ